jgi:hypothetical protein
MNTNRLLAAVLVLQVVTLAGQWGGKPALVSDARADLPPNPAERQLAQTEELKQINSKLDRLISVLGGKLQVEVTNFPKDNGKK